MVSRLQSARRAAFRLLPALGHEANLCRGGTRTQGKNPTRVPFSPAPSASVPAPACLLRSRPAATARVASVSRAAPTLPEPQRAHLQPMFYSLISLETELPQASPHYHNSLSLLPSLLSEASHDGSSPAKPGLVVLTAVDAQNLGPRFAQSRFCRTTDPVPPQSSLVETTEINKTLHPVYL